MEFFKDILQRRLFRTFLQLLVSTHHMVKLEISVILCVGIHVVAPHLKISNLQKIIRITSDIYLTSNQPFQTVQAVTRQAIVGSRQQSRQRSEGHCQHQQWPAASVPCVHQLAGNAAAAGCGLSNNTRCPGPTW